VPPKATPSLLIKKPKLLRSNPYRKTTLINGIYTDVDDEDLIVGDRYRPRFKQLWKELDDLELPEEIQFRLFLARVKALQKYKEIYYNSDSQALNT
jgi:hypothetical protein